MTAPGGAAGGAAAAGAATSVTNKPMTATTARRRKRLRVRDVGAFDTDAVSRARRTAVNRLSGSHGLPGNPFLEQLVEQPTVFQLEHAHQIQQRSVGRLDVESLHPTVPRE